MAETQEKLDIHGLCQQWEKIVLAGRDANERDNGEALIAFTERVFAALPEMAHVASQHDDMCRAIVFLAEAGFDINVQIREGHAFEADDVAKAYITMARLKGWKPPRECD